MYLITQQLYPFGDGTVLVLDLNGQYVWFFEALRNFARGDADMLYSFSRALGGEFLGIYAYYIASPLSFLVCLFPQRMMLEALLALFMLKAALCGLTFGIYMHKTLKERRPLAVITLSIFYTRFLKESKISSMLFSSLEEYKNSVTANGSKLI